MTDFFKKWGRNNPVLFAMITDFGFDFAVASMKALILDSLPMARIIDIDHSIEHFSILSASFVIDRVYKYFPENTIFICVIDPGVGGNRNIMFIDTGKYKFIGPNNGIFHYILKDKNLNSKIYTIKNDFSSVESNTFHGRDIITPVAINLALGNSDILAPLNEKDIVFISSLEKNNFIVTYIDGFGNVKTNFPVSNKTKVGDFIKVRLKKDIYKIRFVKTFCDVKCGELLCYNGSNNTLEIAANLGSARNILGIKVGDTILFED